MFDSCRLSAAAEAAYCANRTFVVCRNLLALAQAFTHSLVTKVLQPGLGKRVEFPKGQMAKGERITAIATVKH